MKELNVYELRVPASIPLLPSTAIEHHTAWDKKVCAICGGLSIMGKSKGRWESGSGIEAEQMVVVQIACTPEQLEQILSMTQEHYKQQAIFVICKTADVAYIYDGKP